MEGKEKTGREGGSCGKRERVWGKERGREEGKGQRRREGRGGESSRNVGEEGRGTYRHKTFGRVGDEERAANILWPRP